MKLSLCPLCALWLIPFGAGAQPVSRQVVEPAQNGREDRRPKGARYMALALRGVEAIGRDASVDEGTPRFEGPYHVVLERLQRLVRYRDQQIARLTLDEGDQRAAAELIRVRHMIRAAHRAVSINAAAKAVAERIDPGEPHLGSPLPALCR